MSLYTDDTLFMRRALDIAMLGAGRVSPNPMVGAVIVDDGKIIGEGWHRRYGGAHAEVNAIESVKKKERLVNSTIYVNLEPCSHFGKTPPCADLIIKHRIKRVVVANLDPNPLVAGKGIERLRQNGIEVETGVLEEEGAQLNRYFFTYHSKNRPYILLKWAQTADGFIARENGDSKWISDRYSRQVVHRLRAETDAIMVGAGTVRTDNPKLNTRDWKGYSPLRVILSTHPMQDGNLNIITDGGPFVNYYTKGEVTANDPRQYVPLDGEKPLCDILTDLHGRGILSLMVEGGTNILQQFIDNELYDEILMFGSDKKFGQGLRGPRPTSSSYQCFKGLEDTFFLS